MPRRQQESDQPEDAFDQLAKVATVLKAFGFEFGPGAQAQTDLQKAQAREAVARAGTFESAISPERTATDLAKTRAETGEIQAHAGDLSNQATLNRVHSHMLTAQMLQQLFPDQPNLAKDYIANQAETDPTLAAAKPVLHKMLELPNAVNRIRSGQTQAGDEELVGGMSPVTLATAKTEAARKVKAQVATSTAATPRIGGVFGQGGYIQRVNAANPYPVIPGLSTEEQLARKQKTSQDWNAIWNTLFGTPTSSTP